MPGSPRGKNFPPVRKAKRAPVPKAEDLRKPWQLPSGIEDPDIFALQALARGEANAGQQARVLELFRDKLCETDRMSFYPGAEDGRRASDFAEGKRWPGLQLKRLLKMRPEKTEKLGERSTPPTQS